MTTKGFNWEKKGRIFKANIPNFTHGSHPCSIHLENDEYLIAFTCRDRNSKSHIFLSRAWISDGTLKLVGETKIALYPGDKGFFDCDGVISVCFVKHEGEYFLYYVGWQNLPEGMWICDTGRLKVDVVNLALHREYLGPVFGRDKVNPLFAAATAFLVENGVWRTWYNSGIKWEVKDNELKHFYGIHYAESQDGVDWTCDTNKMCIPFADEYEYAFGRPSVIVLDGVYYMWFAHRASKDIDKYRIGFAFSHDGLEWERNDQLAGIDVSSDGWDSDMICYPSVFEHSGMLYMLYNGNDYGKTGFGLAVAVKH